MSDANTEPETDTDASPTNDEPEPKLDPSELEPLGETEGIYQRDGEGELTPLPPDAVEWGGEFRQVRFYPTPIGDVAKFRDLGDTVEIEKLCEVLAEKVHTPDRTAEQWADAEPEQFNAVLMALVKKATGETPSSELHEEIRDELDARGDAGGN